MVVSSLAVLQYRPSDVWLAAFVEQVRMHHVCVCMRMCECV
jgi:hypothetical protein